MSSALVGPLSRVWYAGETAPRYHDLPRNTLDLRYEACPDHHPACACREAMTAESFGELRAEIDAMYNAILAAIRGHQTWAWTPDGERDEFAECKCAACGIARAARVGFRDCKRQREEATRRADREHWKRLNGGTLAPVCPDLRNFPPYLDEVPF